MSMSISSRISVSKKFRWEMAHRLSLHPGKCRHLHGHSYTANVTLIGERLDDQGMLVDFSVLGPLKEWIDENLDHSSMFWVNDDMGRILCQAHIATSSERYLHISRVPFQPTAENIGFMLVEKVQELILGPLGLHLDVVVEVFETSKCSATISVSRDENP